MEASERSEGAFAVAKLALRDRSEYLPQRAAEAGAEFWAGTIVVLAVIPGMTTANAATLGVAIAKGAGSAKGAVTLSSVVSVLLGPILGIMGTYFGYRLGVAQTIAEEERRFIRRYLITVWLAAAGLMLLLLGLGVCGSVLGLSAGVRAATIIAAALLYSLMVLLSCFRYERRIREIRAKVVAGRPEMQQAAAAMSERWNIRYRSAWSLFGVPLIDVNMGGTADARPAVAKGWIAIGAKAYGLLFACGAIAIAPLSFGGLAIGVLTWGGCALGVYVWGGFAIGLGALGGVAVGVKAVGACALGWSAAWGAVAVAHGFAQGAVAAAAHVNDEVARDFFDHDLFFRGARIFLMYANWVWILLVVPVLPILLRVRRNRRQAAP